MFGLNPFYRPQSSFERPVPLVFVPPEVDADYHVCFPRAWLPYVLGSLQQLIQPTTWKTTDPDILNIQLDQASLLIARFMQECAAQPIVGEEFTGEELMTSLCEALRFQDGKLQALCCGDWTDVTGQPAQGIGGPTQPGGGSPQPMPGACQSYQAAFNANNSWLVPTVVNSGDVLTFSNARGAGHDGSVSAVWECPSGQIFFAGACVGVPGFQTGDFDPAIAHMRLIAIINGVAYPADAGTITVPGGVSNGQVEIRVNDSNLTDNTGSYTLDVEVCNNAVASWSHVKDLRISNYGLVPFNGGVWTAGVGETSTQVDGSPNNGQQLIADLDFGVDISLTHIKFIFDTVLGSHGGTLFEEFGTIDSGGTYTGRAAFVPPTTGTGQSLSYDSPVTCRKIRLSGILDVRPAPGATDGLWKVYTMELAGTGVDPYP